MKTSERFPPSPILTVNDAFTVHVSDSFGKLTDETPRDSFTVMLVLGQTVEEVSAVHDFHRETPRHLHFERAVKSDDLLTEDTKKVVSIEKQEGEKGRPFG